MPSVTKASTSILSPQNSYCFAINFDVQIHMVWNIDMNDGSYVKIFANVYDSFITIQ